MATLAQLRDAFLEEYLTGRNYKKLDATAASITAPTTSTIEIGKFLPDSSLSSASYIDWTIFRSALAAADADRERLVTSVSSTSSALTLTFTGLPYTNTTPSGNVYLIRLPDGWTIEGDLHSIINAALRKCLYKDWVLLTDVPDGNMRDATPAAYWSVSNATIVNSAAYAWRNTTALKITTTAANGYAESQDIDVEPNRAYAINIIGKIESGTARAVLWNQTTGAAMDNGTHTWSTTPHFFFHYVLTTGTTQRKMRIRLGASGSGDIVHISHTGVHRIDDRYFTLPSYVDSPEGVTGVYELVPSGGSSDDNYVYFADGSRQVPLNFVVEHNAAFSTDAQVVLYGRAGTYPLFAEIVRPGLFRGDTTEDLVSELDTTPVSIEHALPHIAAEFYRRLTTYGVGSDVYDERQVNNLRRAETEAARIRLTYKPRIRRRRHSVYASSRGFG